MGTMIPNPEYKERATVAVDDKGSTLTIGIANVEDAGQYKCSVAVKNPPEVKHTVKIRGIIVKTHCEQMNILHNFSSTHNRVLHTNYLEGVKR